MSIQVTCAVCGKRLNAPDTAAGTRGKCPNCGEVLKVPARVSAPELQHVVELPRHDAAAPHSRHEGTGGLYFRGSRWAQVFGGRITDIVSPPSFRLQSDFIETKRLGVFFLPWTSEVERMPFGKVASYRHLKGLIWDTVIVETTGGSNDLRIRGLRKADAEQLTTALDSRLAVVAPGHTKG